MEFIVGAEYEGKRLSEFLRYGIRVSHALCAECKRREGGIRLDGTPVTVRATVHAGDTVSLAIEDTPADLDPYLTASDLPLSILYEDEHILIVDKPPYMPTHPSHNHRGDTLANALKAEFDRRGLPLCFRAVNRLDADTSGVVLLAKNRYAAERFSKANLAYEKRYLAICHGVFADVRGEIKSYIRREGESIVHRISCADGKPSEFAHTRYRVLEQFRDFALCACEPVTGRTHQLRVHLASIGHPLVGDDFYGGEKCLPRQALHAASLSFVHPLRGEALCIEAPLPSDLADFIEEQRSQNDPYKTVF